MCLSWRLRRNKKEVADIYYNRKLLGSDIVRLKKLLRKKIRAQTSGQEDSGNDKTKVARPVHDSSKVSKMFRSILNNPNFSYQAMVILLTLSADQVPMERRIDTMNTTVDKVRNISDMITNTMQSLKTAAETPKKIRRLLE